MDPNKNLENNLPFTQPGDTLSPPKKGLKKSYLVLSILLIIISLGMWVGAAYLLLSNGTPETTKTFKANAAVSSPIGFLKNISEDSSGKVTAKINGETYKTNYYVKGGQFYLELIPNADIINKFLLQLANKQKLAKGAIKPQDELANLFTASKYVNFGYGTLYQLDGLNHYDPNNLFNFYLPLAIGEYDAKHIPGDSEEPTEKLADNFGRDECQNSAKDLKAYVSEDRLNTDLFSSSATSTSPTDDEIVYKLNSSNLSELPTKLRGYVDACLLHNSKAREADRQFYEDIIKIYEKLPEVTVSTKNNAEKPELSIKVERPQNEDAGRKGSASEYSFIFEPENADKPFEEQKAINGSLDNVVTHFAMAYEKCRFTPVAISDFTRSYNFLVSEEGYYFPNQFTSNYACSTTDESVEGYDPSEPLILDLGQGTSMTIYNPGRENMVQKYHDISHFVEKFFVENGRYPSLQEILANKVDGLISKIYTDPDGKKIGSGTLKYELLPKSCQQNCQNYEIKATLYAPQTNNTIILNHQKFDKRD